METTFGECTDNKKKETVISDCSEVRTEGTSRPSVGMLSHLLRTETKDFESPAIRAHAALGSPPLRWPRCQAVPLGHEQRRTGPCVFERHVCRVSLASWPSRSNWQLRLIFGNVALDHAMGWLKDSEPRCFACYAELRPGPKASAPAGHCCHHLRACGVPAGIPNRLARKSSREPAARAKRMFSGPCSRPRDAIAKRSRLYVAFSVTDPHTDFQRPAANSARGGRLRIRTQFDFNIIIIMRSCMSLGVPSSLAAGTPESNMPLACICCTSCLSLLCHRIRSGTTGTGPASLGSAVMALLSIAGLW